MAMHPVARQPAILLPGGVLPAAVAYPALLEALGPDVEGVAKELEVYSGDQPPSGYGLDIEVAGILATAQRAGFERFHLVGYSGGGAASLAFAASHPQRLLSLALMEPAWAGNQDLSPQEQAVWRQFDRVMALPEDERMVEFVRVQLRPGVVPPARPPEPPPRWMAKRPAGVAAMTNAFKSYDLNIEQLRRFRAPVYYALGALSNPDHYARQATRLTSVFSDFTVEVYERRHHFDPPHAPNRRGSPRRSRGSGHAPPPDAPSRDRWAAKTRGNATPPPLIPATTGAVTSPGLMPGLTTYHARATTAGGASWCHRPVTWRHRLCVPHGERAAQPSSCDPHLIVETLSELGGVSDHVSVAVRIGM